MWVKNWTFAPHLIVMVGRLLVGASILDKDVLMIKRRAGAAHELAGDAGDVRGAHKLRVL
jgi:hypothetical protein